MQESEWQLKISKFQELCEYFSGGYEDDSKYDELKAKILSFNPKLVVFYLALPPSVFIPVSQRIATRISNKSFETRLVVEKPFGKDSFSSAELSLALSCFFTESQIYRIDHYLGKEMVKNMLILRFANVFFDAVWDCKHISNVQITFKETIGVEGRGGYFDEFGIIRDVMQNHLMQILCLIAMEKPKSMNSEHVRDEKVRVLRKIKPLTLDDIIVGQYGPNSEGSKKGYLQDDTVPENSRAATFAAAVLYVDDVRWRNVPFILKCGKALNEQKAEIRIQFQDVPNSLFASSELARNELVIRVQPNEAVYMKIVAKKPGLESSTVISELDLSYSSRYSEVRIPDAYESLVLDVLKGDHSNFVRDDELEAAWKIFTPILKELESVQPEIYPYGSRGPSSVNELIEKAGFQRATKEYIWHQTKL